MLPVYYNRKQNKVCMMNITSRKFYLHEQKFRQTSATIVGMTALSLNRLGRTLYPRLYLYSLTRNFKVSLVLVSILIGILLLWLLVKKRYQPQFEEYINRKPNPKEIETFDEVRRILDDTQMRIIMAMFFTICLLIWSIVLFNRFFSDVNLGTYIWATTLLLSCIYLFSKIDHAFFILKIIPEIMSRKNDNSKSKDK